MTAPAPRTRTTQQRQLMFEAFGFGKLADGKDGFQLFIPGKGDDIAQYTRGGDSHIRQVQVGGDFQKQLGLNAWDPATAPLMTETAHPQGRLFSFALPD